MEKRSVFALARQLVAGFVSLAKLELQHGRQEMAVMLGTVRAAAIMIGIALALVIMALITFVLFLVLVLAALTGLPAWLTGLIVFWVLLVIAALLGWRAIRRVQVGPPEETIASVKEDMAWARRLIRRD